MSRTIVDGPLQVDGSVPTGGVVEYAGSSLPVNGSWLFCDGTIYNISVQPKLFAVIGNTYGGDGIFTFAVPDKRGRTGIGAGTGSGLTLRTLGQTLGEETHLLISTEIPVSGYTVTDPGHNHSVNDSHHTHSLIVAGSNGVTAIQNFGPNQGITGGGPGGGSWAQQVTASSGAFITNSPNTTGITVSNPTGGGSHNNMQPSLVMNYIIKT